MERPNAWKTYNKTELKKLEAVAAEYKDFLDRGSAGKGRVCQPGEGDRCKESAEARG